MNDNSKTMLKIFAIIFGFYLGMMLIWNYTNETHKPSHLFVDWRKEGFKENPLHDRKSDTLFGKITSDKEK